MGDSIKKDNSEMSIMKALGIIAVVLGHTAFPYMRVIYSYHMALFFFVAGYFFKDRYLGRPIEFIKRRLKSYYVPFVAYSILFLFFRNYFVNAHIFDESMRINYSNMLYYIKNIIFFSLDDPLLGTFWFFIIILYVSILFLVINLILNKLKKNNIKNLSLVIFSIYIFAFLLWQQGIDIASFINPNNKSIMKGIQYFFDTKTLILLCIYHTGYLYKKFEESIKIDFRAVIVFLLIIVFYFRDGIYIDISANMYNNPLYFYFAAMIGIYINLYIAKQISKWNVRLLEYIGVKSMYIMIFHLLAFKVVNFIQIKIYKLSIDNLSAYPTLIMNWEDKWWIAYGIAGVFIPILAVYIFDIFKKIKSLFIEKRKVIVNG